MKYFIDTKNARAKARAFAEFKKNSKFRVTGSIANHTITVSNETVEAARKICVTYDVDLKPTVQVQHTFRPTTYKISGKRMRRQAMVQHLQSLTTPTFKGPGIIRFSGTEHTLVKCKTQTHRDVLLSNVKDYKLKAEIFE